MQECTVKTMCYACAQQHEVYIMVSTRSHAIIIALFVAGYVNLFHHPDDTQTALTFRPDIMEKDEIETFPEFTR